MVHMRLQHFDLHPALKGYIEKLWVFEADGPLPSDDMKLIVPNGLIKLVIPIKNGLFGKMQGCEHISKENSLTLIGLADRPSVVDTVYFHGQSSCTIGVEFSPLGAYRFFNLSFGDIKNSIHSFTDVFGKTAALLQEQMVSAPSIPQKVSLLQSFLLQRFLSTENDPLFAYCIQQIKASRGTISIQKLENKTGYSSRWLREKFVEHLGVSPKNLASIVRFQQYFQAMANQEDLLFLQNHFYDFYHDQSHFIKDFKRFTGYAPKKLEHLKNDFGKIFYKE